MERSWFLLLLHAFLRNQSLSREPTLTSCKPSFLSLIGSTDAVVCIPRSARKARLTFARGKLWSVGEKRDSLEALFFSRNLPTLQKGSDFYEPHSSIVVSPFRREDIVYTRRHKLRCDSKHSQSVNNSTKSSDSRLRRLCLVYCTIGNPTSGWLFHKTHCENETSMNKL